MPAHHRGKTGRRHRGGRADLALTADFGAGDRGIELDDAADRRRRQQIIANTMVVGVVVEMQVVADRGGNHACRAIGRRGDDPAACGVLLVDRHRIDAQPVVGEQRIDLVGAPFVLQLVMDHGGAAAHLQPAGQDTGAGQAAVDAALHRRPDAVEALVEFLPRHRTFLVRPLHLGDRQAGARRHLQHLLGGREGIGNLDAARLRLAAPSSPRVPYR